MNFIILHGLEASSRSHWLPWLKVELENKGHHVWLPDLPHAERPDERIWTPFIMRGSPFEFDDNLVIIGWSAGAVEILHLLAQMNRPVRGAVMLAAFINNLGWDNLSYMFNKKFDFPSIIRSGGKLIFMHGSDDPHCPLKDAQYLAEQTKAEIKVIDDAGHFSTKQNPRFDELPELLPVIDRMLA